MADTTIVPLSRAIRQPIDSLVRQRNSVTGRDPNARGVFSSYPFMTPKYMKHRSGRNHEYEDTMSRMFIQVSPKDYKAFISSIPDDETKRIAETLTGDGDKQGGVGYLDFLLQSAEHTLTEKTQIVETLSDNYVAFFFGYTAPIWSYQGTLMNTYQDDWTMRMYRIFRDLARGTQLAKRGLLLHMRYDSLIVSGSMINLRWSLRAGLETACPFSFDLLIKNVTVMYGGYAPPTVLRDETSFIPQGINLAASPSNGSQMQTYVGSPPSGLGPEGIGPQAQSRQTEEWEDSLSQLEQGYVTGTLDQSTTSSPTGASYNPPVTELESDFERVSDQTIDTS